LVKPDSPLRAALYARVSTRDKGQEVDNQLMELRRFCAAQSWLIVREYRECESGGTAARAELQAMLRDAAQRRFDVVVFWALDRLTREGALATLEYLNQLSRYGVAFRSYTEPYLDSCGVFKDAIIAILGTIARQERLRLSERVRAGLERARRLGKRLGRPRAVFDRERARQLRAAGLELGPDRAGVGRQQGSRAPGVPEPGRARRGVPITPWRLSARRAGNKGSCRCGSRRAEKRSFRQVAFLPGTAPRLRPWSCGRREASA
jgi:DNA invertase Pin-like site-specific DNA recombinase